MFKLVGVALAFALGYMSAYNDLFAYLIQEKAVLYIILSIGCCFLLIYIPLERIAEKESMENPTTSLRTSAREHLQRRGSF